MRAAPRCHQHSRVLPHLSPTAAPLLPADLKGPDSSQKGQQRSGESQRQEGSEERCQTHTVRARTARAEG